MSELFEPLPKGPFNIIYADPPWSCWIGGTRNASRHYKCLSIDEIKSLDVPSICAEKAVLFLWVIGPLLPEGIEVMRAWGFRYSGIGFSWMKIYRDGSVAMSGGQTTRKNVELCLIGFKGSWPKSARLSKGVREALISQRGRHSEKHAEFRDRIVKLYGDLPRIELFARQSAPGWTAWGNQAPK